MAKHTEHQEFLTATVTQSLTPPSGSIKNTHYSSSSTDRLAASKAVHQFAAFSYSSGDTTTVPTVGSTLYTARGAGTMIEFSIAPVTVPTGDYQYVVDLQKAADASGSFSTVLSSTITISSADSASTKQTATFSGDATYSAGDRFKLIITPTGSTGAQGAGVTIVLLVAEDPS